MRRIRQCHVCLPLSRPPYVPDMGVAALLKYFPSTRGSSTPVLQDPAGRACAPAFVDARAGAHCMDVLARTGTGQGGTCATLCAAWNDAAPSCKPRPIALPAHAPTLAHLEDTVIGTKSFLRRTDRGLCYVDVAMPLLLGGWRGRNGWCAAEAWVTCAAHPLTLLEENPTHGTTFWDRTKGGLKADLERTKLHCVLVCATQTGTGHSFTRPSPQFIRPLHRSDKDPGPLLRPASIADV
ncbi:hypothetical protein GGX14DRAFT_662601 [Mycena pura]|uniref:Uncharacterized protein n=1 Tax=Mycena pura TaxID=153505 RepID=A0AAD6VXG4_9AGAR|nr:hypothetical protein GGX14DRAFT_662601 [Mycena pura]